VGHGPLLHSCRLQHRLPIRERDLLHDRPGQPRLAHLPQHLVRMRHEIALLLVFRFFLATAHELVAV
jgi:hypothetical protein